MNILDYLNSKAIAAYLEEIGYNFSAYEMAYVIYENKTKTLAEKLDGMRMVCSETPDCEVPLRDERRVVDSTHELIKGYVETAESHLERFPVNHSAWYTIEDACIVKDDGSLCEDWHGDSAFATFEDCLEFLHGEIEDDLPRGDGPRIARRFNIAKRAMNSGERIAWLTLNEDLEPMDIVMTWGNGSSDKDYEPAFENGHVQIPIPFVKGDIVKAAYEKRATPFVFESLKFWDSATLAEHGVKLSNERSERLDRRVARANERRSWDCSHMVGMGYKLAKDMTASDGCMIWEDEFGAVNNYLDLEYYEEPLKGAERILAVVSRFEKDELDVEGLVNLTTFLSLDTLAKNIREFIGTQYVGEIKELIADEVSSKRRES